MKGAQMADGWTVAGNVRVELETDGDGMLFTYQEAAAETNRFGFIWTPSSTGIEVVTVTEESDGTRTESSIDSIQIPDESDNQSGQILAALPWLARNWIEENGGGER
jgi:hypothetical protein